MKRRTLILTVILAACLVLFGLFWMYNRSRTDTKAPKITVEQPEVIPEVSVQDPQSVMLEGMSARDDRDGDVTDLMIIEKITKLDESGQVQVSYAAFDRSGNVAKAQRVFRYTDYEGPRFSLSAPLIYHAGTQFDILSNMQANDWLDGDIRHRIKTTAMDSTYLTEVGVHQVQFRATNSLGDKEMLTLPVEVVEAGTYTGQVKLTDYLIYLSAGAEFDPQDYLQTYVHQSRSISLTSGIPDELDLWTQNVVDTHTPGVYTVTYTMKYSSGGASSMGYTKLIVVVEG